MQTYFYALLFLLFLVATVSISMNYNSVLIIHYEKYFKVLRLTLKNVKTNRDNLLCNLPQRFLETYFSTGRPVPPSGPLAELPMAVITD